MAELVLPPDTGTRYRTRANRWCRLYDREGDDLVAPNYAAWVADIVTGLYQAKPPTITKDGNPLEETADDPDTGDADSDTLDEGEDTELTDYVVDLLCEAGERQAGTGLAVLRPVHDGERWTHQVLDPSQVAPTWSHRRLTAAVVWTVHRHPRFMQQGEKQRIAVVEYWGLSRDGTAIEYPETVVAVGEVDDKHTKFTAPDSHVYTELASVPSEIQDLPFVAAAFDTDTTPRTLITVPWKWASGDPVPIYFRNEGILNATEKLHDVEHTDAVMVRKRVAISQDLLGKKDVTYEADGSKVIAYAGWQVDQNLLVLDTPSVAWSEDGSNAPLEQIEFSDDLTQANRIDRRREWILTHCGINPQSVGMSVSGRSDSAAAKRADQQQTMNTVSRPARRLSAALSLALTQEDRLNGDGDTFQVTVNEGLKPVLSEMVDIAAKMSSATDMASTPTIVATAQPGLSPEAQQSELDRMGQEGRLRFVDE